MGFWHGDLGSNNISFGSDLGGAHNMVLIQGLEAFGNGFGGCIAPPIASKLRVIYLPFSGHTDNE